MAVIAAAAYLVGGSFGSNGSAGAVAAMAAVPSSRTVLLLEQQRQQLIALTAASRTLSLVGQPRLASRQQPSQQAAPGSPGSVAAGPPAAPPNPGTAQSIAYHMLSQFGWNPQTYFSCLNNIWTRESGWLWNAQNASGAYGIPQALPAAKMATAGADWQTNPATQIKWGLTYIQSTYGDPCSAWGFWQGHSYY